MLKADRSARILAHVTEAGSADVHALAGLLGVSTATVRRDLQELHEQGLLHRTRGGAVTGPVNLELPLRHRSEKQREEKRRIAQAAAELVPDGAVVGLSGGTTTSELARVLAERGGITVVTNAVNVAADLIVRPEVRLVVIGGIARTASYELVGPAADLMLSRYHLDVAFIGVDGLTAEEGCTTHDEMEAQTDRAFLRSSARAVVLADSTKAGRVTFARICPLADVDDLVTDAGLTDAQAKAFAACGVRVRRA
ncbi:DeoR/GlpR family DNA-binding transcription regulator [Kitasatospora sp. A2-31]|uniref:DeoR/GlpR family DNA-binding transcription regulator n=2 Tax=Kitasatospora sp. A2-31 TaxID=2916414 RepID=UPI001EEE5381|nr:DeoR/GlpR family DNA-binding transcription regulator [Kitasatospora sp. A2-31]MCG6499295.1 DeoR/GlpR family DNA-binding transcription regulator [Kitasatospora sp. A2-31]MCG6500310.1 DeoR/GlpR family DNA-binding transcription regulator [Kitasatospora sp. A2-31]